MGAEGYTQGPLSLQMFFNLLWEAGARSVSVVALEFHCWSLQGMFLSVSHACHTDAVLRQPCVVLHTFLSHPKK